MQTPPTVSFVGLPHDPKLAAVIDREIESIERFYPRITTCNVRVQAPHRHHRTGANWHVHVELHVPGDQLVVDHEREIDARHEDAAAAVRDAFHALRRKLQDRARLVDGRTKRHAPRARRPG